MVDNRQLRVRLARSDIPGIARRRGRLELGRDRQARTLRRGDEAARKIVIVAVDGADILPRLGVGVGGRRVQRQTAGRSN